jgi:hypothetical protein
VLNADGTKPASNPDRSSTTTLYSRGGHTLRYSKAGLGPHAEIATDPNNISRSIFVELKGTEPKDCRVSSTSCQWGDGTRCIRGRRPRGATGVSRREAAARIAGASQQHIEVAFDVPAE